MRRILIICFALVYVLSFNGCEKIEDFTEHSNPNQPSTGSYISSLESALKAVNAVYGKLQGAGLYSNKYIGLISAKSDLFVGRPEKPHFGDAQTFKRTPEQGSENFQYVWRDIYMGVWWANQVIERVTEDYGMSNDKNIHGESINYTDRIIAEARFLKGYFYFIGLNYFGKIIPKDNLPLVASDFNGKLISGQEAFLYVEGLMLESLDYLPVEYSNINDNGRLTRGAALGFLGKLYLYWSEIDKAKYNDAIKVFEEVMDPLYGYSLIPEWDENFTEVNEYNNESLFEVGYTLISGYETLGEPWNPDSDTRSSVGEHNVHEQIFGPLTHISDVHIGWHEGYPSAVLINKFEPDDPRKESGIYSPGDTIWGNKIVSKLVESGPDTIQNYFFAKWLRKEATADPSLRKSEINRRLLRLADIYLMYAECLMKTGNLDGAIEYINKVRERAGATLENPDFPLYTSSDFSSLADVYRILEHERAVECFFEYTRFYDLRRWSKDPECPFDPIAMIQAVHPLYTINKHEYAPIPQEEIDVNSELDSKDQNSGY